MPTYEFRCPNGHDFEKFYRKISDASAELPCPECGAVAPRRVSGGAGLVFKGSGFYLTDYGKDAHRKPAPSASAKDDATGGEGKRETAAESTGEAAGSGTSGAKGESKASEAKASEAKASEAKATPGKGGTGSTGASSK